jgi:hypothetical protein
MYSVCFDTKDHYKISLIKIIMIVQLYRLLIIIIIYLQLLSHNVTNPLFNPPKPLSLPSLKPQNKPLHSRLHRTTSNKIIIIKTITIHAKK